MLCLPIEIRADCRVKRLIRYTYQPVDSDVTISRKVGTTDHCRVVDKIENDRRIREVKVYGLSGDVEVTFHYFVACRRRNTLDHHVQADRIELAFDGQGQR